MIYDNPPHRCSLYSSTQSTDAAGGMVINYTLEQSAVTCLINTVSAATKIAAAQAEIDVSNTIGILTSYLTVAPKPGWKAVADDTGNTYKIVGIRRGRQSALGTIPSLTYLDVSEQL